MNGFYTPPQRNFDGSVLRRALQAQLTENLEANEDSSLWADRAMFRAKRCLTVMGDTQFDAVMDHFSESWFESRTWKQQADAYLSLLVARQGHPLATVAELVAAFGVPDIQ